MPKRLRVCGMAGCPELTSRTSGRCDEHERHRRRQEDKQRGTRTARGLDNQWLRLRDNAVRAHVAEHGWTCPGWNRPPHQVEPGSLTGDHITSRSAAPERRLDPANISVLCLSCNAAKGSR